MCFSGTSHDIFTISSDCFDAKRYICVTNNTIAGDKSSDCAVKCDGSAWKYDGLFSNYDGCAWKYDCLG